MVTNCKGMIHEQHQIHDIINPRRACAAASRIFPRMRMRVRKPRPRTHPPRHQLWPWVDVGAEPGGPRPPYRPAQVTSHAATQRGWTGTAKKKKKNED